VKLTFNHYKNAWLSVIETQYIASYIALQQRHFAVNLQRTTPMTNFLTQTGAPANRIGSVITEILTATTIALAGFLALLTVAVNV
jgi:hypothetical protein